MDTSQGSSPNRSAALNSKDAEVTGDGESHVPLGFPVLDYVNELRFKHGIKLEEYARYHKYCSRKLHVLRKQLKNVPSKFNKYVHEEFPDPLNDNRYLEILTVRCDRSWSRGMDLKSKCETSSVNNNKGRHYYMRKFAKAYRLAALLEEYCRKYADNNSANNAKVYRNFMEGVLRYEQEKFEEAHACLSSYSAVMEQRLRTTSGLHSSDGYNSQLGQLNALIKMCTFHMKVAGKTLSTPQTHYSEDGNAELIMVKENAQGDYAVYCKGVAIPVESHLLPQKILDALDSIDRLALTDELFGSLSSTRNLETTLNEQLTSRFSKQELLNNYDDVTSLFDLCTDDVYSELMSNMDNQEPLRKLEDSLVLMKSLLGVEKHLVLLTLTLDGLLSNDSQGPLPDTSEGIRYANILKQQLASLMSDASFGSSFLVPNEVVRTVNALLLSIYSFHKGELNEGMALVHWSNTRSAMNVQLPDKHKNRLLWRCLTSFGNLQAVTSLVLSRFYQRLFAMFARSKLANEVPEDDSVLSLFDIEKKLVFCRPLLFDLAFIYYEPPELQTGTRFKGNFHSLTSVSGVRNILSSLWN